MRGTYSIEAENTDGDRRVVVTIDAERYSYEHVHAEAENELRQPNVWKVRVYQETGRRTLLFTRDARSLDG